MAERKQPAPKASKGAVAGNANPGAGAKTAAGRTAKAAAIPAAARKTERMNVWLLPDQVAWLKSKKNASETMRSLVAEAMSMEMLAKSVLGARRKK